MINDQEAAQILFMMSQSEDLSFSTKIVGFVRKEDSYGHIHHFPLMESTTKPPKHRNKLTMAYNTMINDEEAAHILIMISRSQPLSTKQNVVSKEDPIDYIHECPTTNPLRNGKKRPPLLLPVGKQPKKAKTKTDNRLAAGTSSLWTTEPAPEWLLELMTNKNGAHQKKVIEKKLWATDVSPSHNRLSMPFSNIIDLKFLNPAEERIIEEDDEKSRKAGVNAKLVVKLKNSDKIKEFDVSLRRWKMEKKSGNYTFVYNLVKGWYQVVKDCRLKVHDNICLWSFRSDGKLYFALFPSPRIRENPNSRR